MKIAIASSDKNIDATIDRHFAKCSYFAFYETTTNVIEFETNPCRDLPSEAGIACAEFLNIRGIIKVISGEFGLKAKAELEKFRIQMVLITDHNKSLSEIIELLKTEK